MHYLDHLLECLIGPSLKVLQLRRLFDWTNMAAALHQFFGAARHPCFEVSVSPGSFLFLPRVETRGIIEARDSAPVTETKSM